MKKKLQVFISSTYGDLVDERQEAVAAILDAGHIPAGMELFKAGEDKLETIYKWIDDSDVYLLILGGRYGAHLKRYNKSFIELEYRYAEKKGKPIFTILLSDPMILSKTTQAVQEGKQESSIRESDHKDLYNQFKKYVSEEKVRYKVDNLDQLSSKIISQLNKLSEELASQPIGWIKADSVVSDISSLSEEQLSKIQNNCLNESISRFYKGLNVSSFANTLVESLPNALYCDGLFESVDRVIQLEPISDGLIKVITSSRIKYIHLNEEHREFGIMFHSTKQQAESFRVEKLLIGEKDYSDQLITEYCEEGNRGQLNYCVKSVKSIPIASLSSEIYFENSYECPPLDFFQSHSLPFPCGQLNISVYMKGGLDKQYSIVSSTHSSSSKSYADSFASGELRNFSVFSLKLPPWSLAGSGYTITLKRKSTENH